MYIPCESQLLRFLLLHCVVRFINIFSSSVRSFALCQEENIFVFTTTVVVRARLKCCKMMTNAITIRSASEFSFSVTPSSSVHGVLAWIASIILLLLSLSLQPPENFKRTINGDYPNDGACVRVCVRDECSIFTTRPFPGTYVFARIAYRRALIRAREWIHTPIGRWQPLR